MAKKVIHALLTGKTPDGESTAAVFGDEGTFEGRLILQRSDSDASRYSVEECHVPVPGLVHIVDNGPTEGGSRGPTRVNNSAYRAGWERIFGKKTQGGKPN